MEKRIGSSMRPRGSSSSRESKPYREVSMDEFQEMLDRDPKLQSRLKPLGTMYRGQLLIGPDEPKLPMGEVSRRKKEIDDRLKAKPPK